MKTKTLLVSLSFASLTATGCNDSAPDGGDSFSTGFGGDSDGDAAGTDGTDGDDDSDGTDSDDGGSTGEPEDTSGQGCGGDTIIVNAAIPDVMLVLDKSGSMYRNRWDHDGDDATAKVTRWWSLHGVVTEILGRYETTMHFGAALFPRVGADHSGAKFDLACPVAEDGAEVAMASMNAQGVLEGIPAAGDEVRGGTPATAGFASAMAEFDNSGTGDSRAVILVTDGVANCVDADAPFRHYDENLRTVVQEAYGAGVPTHVVGIDITEDPDDNSVGVNAREKLNEVAQVGGVPAAGDQAFYSAGDHLELQDALDKIAASIECTVNLPSRPPHPDYVEVTIGGEAYDRVDDCEDGDGWRFTSDRAPYNTIELCGAACPAFGDSGTLETDYACPPVG